MRLLARRTIPCIGDFEIAVADAKVGIAILRQRCRAINGWRARMQIDHVGVERSVHHLPALAGIEPIPATRHDIRALLDAAASIRKLVRLHKFSSACACVVTSRAAGAAIMAMKPRIMPLW
jgi:hypothetical protein